MKEEFGYWAFYWLVCFDNLMLYDCNGLFFVLFSHTLVCIHFCCVYIADVG